MAGGAFIKLGQLLAMRYDLLPSAYCQELSLLLDRLPPSRGVDVVRRIEQDLGKPLSECFKTFDELPMSSASVAQVHAATLLDGHRVVVKIRHPGIEDRYRVDLINLKVLLRCLRFARLLQVDVSGVAIELERLAAEELDFRHEARNIYLLHELLKQDDVDHCAPRVYLELSGASVITMERLDGVWVHEILDALNSDDQERLTAWSTKGITPERTARLLLYSILTQSLTHRLFHADPHAGNLIVLEGGTLGYVDFGMVGWLDEVMCRQQFILNEAIATEQIHRAYRALLDTMEPLPKRDLSAFEREVKRLMMEWLFATKVPGTPIRERSGASFFLNLFEVMQRERLRMSVASLRFVRTLVISDIIALRLDPALDRLAELRVFFGEQVWRQLEEASSEEGITVGLQVVISTLLRALGAVPSVVDWLSDRLPEFGRRYEGTLSAVDEAILVLLRYLRGSAVLGFLALIAGQFLVWYLGPATWLARVFEPIQRYKWTAASVTLLVSMILRGVIKRFEAKAGETSHRTL
jgi:ubiquinone biosynthesis protein